MNTQFLDTQEPISQTQPEPAKTIEELSTQIASLTGLVGYLIGFADAIFPKAGQKVAWEVKNTQAGITLEGSTASVQARGVLLGAHFLPTGPGQGAVMFIIRPDGQQSVTVTESSKVRFLDD